MVNWLPETRRDTKHTNRCQLNCSLLLSFLSNTFGLQHVCHETTCKAHVLVSEHPIFQSQGRVANSLTA